MTITKTVLEWPYQPPDFFEAPYRQTAAGYDLLVDAGIVTVTLTSPQDPVSEILRSQIASEVEAIFIARQLRTHRHFALEGPRDTQHMAGGTKSIAIALCGEMVALADTVDVVLTDPAGNVIRDSKAERIADDARFVDALVPKISKPSLLKALLGSYSAAVDDPSDELTHLYEVREALARHYGGDGQAQKTLGITKADWKQLG